LSSIKSISIVSRILLIVLLAAPSLSSWAQSDYFDYDDYESDDYYSENPYSQYQYNEYGRRSNSRRSSYSEYKLYDYTNKRSRLSNRDENGSGWHTGGVPFIYKKRSLNNQAPIKDKSWRKSRSNWDDEEDGVDLRNREYGETDRPNLVDPSDSMEPEPSDDRTGGPPPPPNEEDPDDVPIDSAIPFLIVAALAWVGFKFYRPAKRKRLTH
jgi:hypothetical protein